MGTSSNHSSPARIDTNPTYWVPAIPSATDVSARRTISSTGTHFFDLFRQQHSSYGQGTAKTKDAVSQPISYSVADQHGVQWSHRQILLHSFWHSPSEALHGELSSFSCRTAVQLVDFQQRNSSGTALQTCIERESSMARPDRDIQAAVPKTLLWLETRPLRARTPNESTGPWLSYCRDVDSSLQLKHNNMINSLNWSARL